MRLNSIERELLGNVAFDLGTFELVSVPAEGEEPSPICGKYVYIMRKQADGSWKLSRYMWNFTPPPVE
jgi:ketosteroid isomerase-like protein